MDASGEKVVAKLPRRRLWKQAFSKVRSRGALTSQINRMPQSQQRSTVSSSDKEKNAAAKQIISWSEFMENSTFHGVRNIFNSNLLLRR